MEKTKFQSFSWGHHKKAINRMIFLLWIIVQCLIAVLPFFSETLFNVSGLPHKYLSGVCILSCFFSVLVFLERKRKVLGKSIWLPEIICFSMLCFGQLEIALGILYNFKDIAAGVWNVLLILFCLLFLSLILRRIKWAMITLNLMVLILGIVNHYFYLFRKQPLFLSDILLFNTATTVLGNYTFRVNGMLFCFLLIQFGNFLSCLLKLKEKLERKLQSAFLVGCFAILLGKVGYTPFLNNWNMVHEIQDSGYINVAVEKALRDGKNEPPENYSMELAEEILEQYKSEEELEEPVNLIVIMNEAFSDLPDIYGFETDVDGMPFIHSLKENTVKGNLVVSVLGGGTATTEYEFLTGNTYAFFNKGISPYLSVVKKKSPSLAWDLKELGYQTIAFHPGSLTAYNRYNVYQFLGFDEFVSLDSELNYRDNLRWMMSDESDYKNVIDIYENKKDARPLFIFNITMQNHGGYGMDESAVEVTVKPSDVSLQRPELLEYLSLIKISDEAFGKLVEYFSDQDEKTIVLMFGDHQPGFGGGVRDILNKNVKKDSSSIKGNAYITPFILWANYDIPEKKDVIISPGFLRGLLLDTAGVPLSNYDRFLAEVRKKYAAVNYRECYDNAGNAVSWEDVLEDEQIKQWEILQYANAFGKN